MEKDFALHFHVLTGKRIKIKGLQKSLKYYL